VSVGTILWYVSPSTFGLPLVGRSLPSSSRVTTHCPCHCMFGGILHGMWFVDNLRKYVAVHTKQWRLAADR
jgi:hypothetical protein